MTNVSLGSIGVAVDNAVVKSVQCEPQLLSESTKKKTKEDPKIKSQENQRNLKSKFKI